MTDPTVEVLSTWGPAANAALRAIAAEAPVAADAAGPLWVLRYAEIDRLAHDRRLQGVGLTFFDLMGIPEGPLRRWYSALMFTNEGDEHTRLRRLVSRALDRKSVV